MTGYLEKHAKTLKYEAGLLSPILNQFDPQKFHGLLSKSLASQAVKKEFVAKLGILFDHYGLDGTSEQDYLDLAVLLAHDWIPGFKVVNRLPTKGRKPIRKDSTNEAIENEVEQIRAAISKGKIRSVSLQEACRKFLKVHQNEPRWKDASFRTISNICADAKRVRKRNESIVEALRRQGGSANQVSPFGPLFQLGRELSKPKDGGTD